MRAAVLLALLAAFVASCGAAGAWTLGTGTQLRQGNTVVTLGLDLDLGGNLTFETGTNAPIIDGYTLDLQREDAGAYEWTILNWSTANFTLQGAPTMNGTLRLAGIMGTYNVHGVAGMGDFAIFGPDASFTVPPGAQTITITPTDLQLPPQLQLDAEWSWASGDLTAAIALQDSDGAPITGTAGLLLVRLYEPDGVLHGTINMSEVASTGVYRGTKNITLYPQAGVWVVTATYAGGLPQAQAVIIMENIPELIHNLTLPGPLGLASTKTEMAMPYFILILMPLVFVALSEYTSSWGWSIIGGVVGFAGYLLLLYNNDAAQATPFLKILLLGSGILSLVHSGYVFKSTG